MTALSATGAPSGARTVQRDILQTKMPSVHTRRAFLTSTAAAMTPGLRAADKDPAREWRYYGADPGATRYSPLDQINRSNVKRLRIAWTHHTEDSVERPATTIECTP